MVIVNYLKNIKSHALVSAGFWFILLLFLIFSGAVYLNIIWINEKLDEITHISFPTVESGDDLIITLHESGSLAKSAILCKSVEELEEIEKKADNVLRINKEAVAKLDTLADRYPVFRANLEKADREFKAYTKSLKDLINARRDALSGKSGTDAAQLQQILDKKIYSVTGLLNLVIDRANMRLQETDMETGRAIKYAKILIIILFIITAAIGMFITYIITNAIKGAEEKKNNALKEIDRIFNTASAGMWLINGKLEIVRVNDTFLKMTGMAKDQVIGKKSDAVWNRFKIKTGNKKYNNIVADKVEYIYEKTLSVGRGNSIICSITAVPFLFAVDGTTGILESFTDITEKRQIEKEIMQAISIERQRIGQDLHDGIGQKLTGLSYLNQAIKSSLKDKKYKAGRDMDESINTINEIINQTRLLSKSLYPVNLEKFGLVTALYDLSVETSQLFDVSCEAEIKKNLPAIDQDAQINLYYITKEAINNSIKHGNADKIIISLSEDPVYITLEITDNGKKKKIIKNEKNRIKTGGIGMRIMEYRAELIGAGFKAEDTGGGFIVSVKYRKQADKI